MYRLVVIASILAVASAGLIGAPLATPLAAGLPATLLPRINLAPAQTTIVRQPVVVQQPEPILRSVPVPVRAISYAAAPTVLASPWASSIAAAPIAGTPLIADARIASPWAAAPLAAPWGSSVLLK